MLAKALYVANIFITEHAKLAHICGMLRFIIQHTTIYMQENKGFKSLSNVCNFINSSVRSSPLLLKGFGCHRKLGLDKTSLYSNGGELQKDSRDVKSKY